MIDSNKEKAALSDKSLRVHSLTLSKFLSSSVVEKVAASLRGSGTITELERQVIWSQPTDMEKAMKLVEIVMRKGCNTCQLFYSSLEICSPSIFERVTGLTAQLPLDTSVPERDNSTPTYIINIQNSTLSHCIIGNSNYHSVVTEQQPLLAPAQGKPAEGCSCSCGHQMVVQTTPPEPQGIQVQGSYLKYVMVGDDNTMEVKHILPTAREDESGLEG